MCYFTCDTSILTRLRIVSQCIIFHQPYRLPQLYAETIIIQGMEVELDLSGSRFNSAVWVFNFGHLVAGIPAAILFRKFDILLGNPRD
ncbi:uncharacterized protein BCR38DRAFT_447961 [Pseudomassariella vexata]|uniref:Uncharacterized protein n=1 Tax=Pseudomassariella vexata TaxID=1141098 RepID=A0A1Y2DFL3_9PEZI|nr:uncharacterized protein BCR38DRAFT_447961 [Pseudomassariella vexata]ORY58083.1 hypothetical protein BCR38DRAFT_447961 [Pseudomassariella vexata]